MHYIIPLYELFPNAKYVLLERDRFECENSITKWVSPSITQGNFIERKFDRWYCDIHNMEQIIPEFKRINFYQMNNIKNISLSKFFIRSFSSSVIKGGNVDFLQKSETSINLLLSFSLHQYYTWFLKSNLLYLYKIKPLSD